MAEHPDRFPNCSLERISMESNQLRGRVACFTSPRRGEVGSRLRDPGEGVHGRRESPAPLTRNGRAKRAHSDLSPAGRGYSALRLSQWNTL